MSNFYSTPAWRTLRRRVLALYGDACMNCTSTPKDTGKSSHIDHIVPRSVNESLQLEITNMQVLCEHCNVEIKGVHTIDYRTESHRNLLENRYGKVKRVSRVIQPTHRHSPASEDNIKKPKDRMSEAYYDLKVSIRERSEREQKQKEREQMTDAARWASLAPDSEKPGRYTKGRVDERKRKKAIKHAKHEANRLRNLAKKKP